MAVLEVGHPLFQRLGTRGGHLVTKEGDLGCLENARCRVDDDPIPPKLIEEVLFVFFEWRREERMSSM
jgi:hypothetical protein